MPTARPLSFPTFHFTITIKSRMELIVYSAPWCHDCREAKRWLARHQIPYQEIDIDQIPDAAQEVVKNTGKRAIPQFVINGTWVQPYTPGLGFKYDEMAELFGVPAD